MSALDDLLARARRRAAGLSPAATRTVSPAKDFRAAIAGRDKISVIAEFKRSSPSLGTIRGGADVARQVAAYVEGGAAAISVLTEPSRFGGSYEDLRVAVATVDVPVLMKDFVVSPRQVELAAELGAAAVLLIVRCLSAAELREFAGLAVEHGMTPFVECHEPEEFATALSIPDAVIGLNHRNLATLAVDFEGGRGQLRELPADRVLVSESGVQRPEQIRNLRGVADAVLVGTALMRAERPAAFIKEALA